MARILIYSNTSLNYQKKTRHYLTPIPNSRVKRDAIFKTLKKQQELIATYEASLKTAKERLKLLCPHPPDQVTVEVDTISRSNETTNTVSTGRCKLCESLLYNITQEEGDLDLP